MRELKIRELKYISTKQKETAGVEIEGLETSARSCRGGKCGNLQYGLPLNEKGIVNNIYPRKASRLGLMAYVRKERV